jgi:hypothetical protein
MADMEKNKGTLINILDLPEAEITKGIQFNPDVEYDFEITDVTATKRKTVKDGHEKEFVVIDAHCSEATQDASLKMSFFHNDKVTIDEENKKRESGIVKFARGIGYPVSLGKKIKFGEIIKPGISFKAHTRLQKDPKTGQDSVYSEIDFDTIKPGKKGVKMQTKIDQAIEPAAEAELKALAGSYMKFEHLVQGLVQMGKSSLITPASILNQEGKLIYKQA